MTVACFWMKKLISASAVGVASSSEPCRLSVKGVAGENRRDYYGCDYATNNGPVVFVLAYFHYFI